MPSIIDDLQDPFSLPDRTRNVSVVQTHISIVFVADEFVYKIKKPVNFGFLDFSTLEKRKFYCYMEINLNRRLSKDIYLDVLPVVFDGKRYTMKSGPGNVVEYAVKMKRIPEEMLLKSVFERGDLSNHHLRGIAKVLADFHARALRTPEIDKFGESDRFRINTDENFEQIEKYIGTSITHKDFHALERWTDNFYDTHKDLFLMRLREGRIRDCHGDLHMEHICLTEEISIIDCIEFNERFRYGDTAADIAFLLMDLDYHGGKDHATRLWEYYRELTGEKDVEALLAFFKVYRAVVRGKVNSFQVDDEALEVEIKEEAIRMARKYFQLACSYIQSTDSGVFSC